MYTKKLYDTPVFQFTIPIDNEKLAEGIYRLKEEDSKGVPLSNQGGWHSKPMYSDPQFNTPIDEVFTPITNVFPNILPTLPFQPPINRIGSIGIWANINQRGDYNISHNHPTCDMSGVYYVKVPKGDSGALVFEDPRPAYVFGNRFYVDRYTQGNMHGVTPEEGTMFLFPSSLMHSVLANKTDEDRISISFNIVL
tara:strand:- start:1636 stop:2220 length:585 start_codon:yes stop_codon:yes gene_type:complete